MKRLIALAIACSAAAAWGADTGDNFNVDCSIGWGGCYRPMQWTPVEISIFGRNDKPFGGTVTVTARQDELSRMAIHHQIVITPDVPLHLPLQTKLTYAADNYTVTIRDDRGIVRWRNDYQLWDFSESEGVLTAVRRNDIDGSIELLREMDRYLSPQEAAALAESARGVFRKKLHNLGMEFSFAVNEKRWPAAVTTGEQIAEGFPNSRMAMEVRQKLDALRQLASAEST